MWYTPSEVDIGLRVYRVSGFMGFVGLIWVRVCRVQGS